MTRGYTLRIGFWIGVCVCVCVCACVRAYARAFVCACVRAHARACFSLPLSHRHTNTHSPPPPPSLFRSRSLARALCPHIRNHAHALVTIHVHSIANKSLPVPRLHYLLTYITYIYTDYLIYLHILPTYMYVPLPSLQVRSGQSAANGSLPVRRLHPP